MNMKAFITLPLYHNHGICNLYRAVWSKKSIHLYNADLPLTCNYLIKTFKAHEFEIFYGVPYALKLLAEAEEGLSLLAQLKILVRVDVRERPFGRCLRAACGQGQQGGEGDFLLHLFPPVAFRFGGKFSAAGME